MSFRLTTLLWAFALVASAMATFGLAGVVVSALTVLTWMEMFSRSGRSRVRVLLIVALAIVLLFMFVLHGLDWGMREYARRAQCHNNLRNHAIALTWYAEKNVAFPPAAEPGEAGAGPRSWRVAILNHLDERALAERYRLDEAWDGPNNVMLSQQPMPLFGCPSDPAAAFPPTTTNYFAVVGTHTAWPPDRGRPIREISDGTPNTILLVEMAGRNTPWSKPADLTFDEVLALLTNPPTSAMVHSEERYHGFFYKRDRRPGVNVAFADGTVRFITLPLSPSLATALLTADGGELVDERELNRASLPQLDYGKIYAFATFVALSLLPAWRLINRDSPSRSE